MNKVLNVFFSNTIISGHEMQFLKIIKKLDKNININLFVNKTNKIYFENISNKIHYFNKLSFFIKILFLKNKNRNILFVSGSPYAFPFYKLVFKLLFFDIIEYTPFSEKYIRSDRFHHFFLPLINKYCVKYRILIDEWQINGSSVKNNLIIKNIV